MKKQQTLISAEEQHLAEMSKTSSTSTTSATVKKVKKTSKSSVKKSISMGSSTEEVSSTSTLVESAAISQDNRKSKQLEKLTKIQEQTKEDTTTISSQLDDGRKAIKSEGSIAKENKKKSKSKKSKKSEANTESISVKSSFSKFDALQKQTLYHDDKNVNCKLCSKPVYKMEEIKAEKNVYHKNCFRCHECNKQLKVDNYESHEGHPYCMIHFKLLFAPKAVEDADNEMPSRKPELIIRENEPLDLPPDVVRASDVPDLGLEDLHQLNVRSRFQVFEKASQQKSEEQQPLPTAERPVKRSTTILSKVAKLQAHGFSDSIDGETVVLENSGSSSTEAEDSTSCVEDGIESEDVDLVRSKKRTRERPVGIGKAMDDIKTKFEKGPFLSKDERREERKQEIQSIRSRLFMGKQARIKEMYQQAVADSAIVHSKKPEVEIDGVTRSIKERFEKGEIFKSDHDENGEANDEKLGDIGAENFDISEKFKFFETYRPAVGQKKQFRITPPRDGVVKMPHDSSHYDEELTEANNNNEETNLLESSRTTAKMLDKFREMEKNKNKRQGDNGPRPLKCFTPPPDGGKRVLQADDSEQESEYTEESSEEDDDDAVKKADDAALLEAKAAARAKQLRAKFEKWEADEIQREIHDNRIDIYSQTADDNNIESTKSIRERFENMKTAEARNPARPRYQVNRFV